jgi:hypothetical protein
MVEDKKNISGTLAIGLREGCNVGMKEERCGEFGAKLSDKP